MGCGIDQRQVQYPQQSSKIYPKAIINIISVQNQEEEQLAGIFYI